MGNGKNNRGEIEITRYTDYVLYLNNLFEFKRKKHGYSYRVFCRKSGFKSPTYLKWVIDGARPISLKSVHKFIAGLSLDKREAQYFGLMVNYKAATDLQTRRYYYEQMLDFRRRHASSLTKDAYAYLSHWYYVAIRELIAEPNFKEDLPRIRDRLGGDLTLREIRNALETLERLKLIKRGTKGRWEQVSKDLNTGEEVESLAAYNYHNEMLELSQQALHKRRPEERDYRSIVTMLDGETYQNIKGKIQQFQRELLLFLENREKIVSQQCLPRELYALNMQLIPLTMSRKEIL